MTPLSSPGAFFYSVCLKVLWVSPPMFNLSFILSYFFTSCMAVCKNTNSVPLWSWLNKMEAFFIAFFLYVFMRKYLVKKNLCFLLDTRPSIRFDF
ncbi:hypothetical protein BDF14DRAFT_1765346 [Spinellus fusiger]|nr:hypothetical protein BDF14DRAFT_1765346 [Spinellus fusiger]